MGLSTRWEFWCRSGPSLRFCWWYALEEARRGGVSSCSRLSFLRCLRGLFFFALSLAGQFEIGLSLTSVGGELAQKQGYTGSFFTGVLATVVATPCTAPLMGAAVGFALAQPAWITFAVFTALALGLAAPYLAVELSACVDADPAAAGRLDGVFKQLTAVRFSPQ